MSIKELNSIYAFGYGLFIYSPSTFNEWMQEKKCRAKKMLSYFDKHNFYCRFLCLFPSKGVFVLTRKRQSDNYL